MNICEDVFHIILGFSDIKSIEILCDLGYNQIVSNYFKNLTEEELEDYAYDCGENQDCLKVAKLLIDNGGDLMTGCDFREVKTLDFLKLLDTTHNSYQLNDSTGYYEASDELNYPDSPGAELLLISLERCDLEIAKYLVNWKNPYDGSCITLSCLITFAIEETKTKEEYLKIINLLITRDYK